MWGKKHSWAHFAGNMSHTHTHQINKCRKIESKGLGLLHASTNTHGHTHTNKQAFIYTHMRLLPPTGMVRGRQGEVQKNKIPPSVRKTRGWKKRREEDDEEEVAGTLLEG